MTEETDAALGEAFAALLPHAWRSGRLPACWGTGAAGRSRGSLGQPEGRAGRWGGRVHRRARVVGVDSAGGAAGRVRAVGAGRKRLRESDPGLMQALSALVEPDQRGAPESPLRWTIKSTRNLAAELTRPGHQVGADTVAALLKQEGFFLQGTSRTTEGARHPDRDAQFRYINDQVKAFTSAGQPVISVDTKKKEVLGSPTAAVGDALHELTPILEALDHRIRPAPITAPTAADLANLLGRSHTKKAE